MLLVALLQAAFQRNIKEHMLPSRAAIAALCAKTRDRLAAAAASAACGTLTSDRSCLRSLRPHVVQPSGERMPRIVLVGTVGTSGFGNQIEMYLRHLTVAREMQLPIVLPFAFPRQDGWHSYPPLPPEIVFDFDELEGHGSSRVDALRPSVLRRIPSECTQSQRNATKGKKILSPWPFGVHASITDDVTRLVRAQGTSTVCLRVGTNNGRADWSLWGTYLKMAKMYLQIAGEHWDIAKLGVVHLRWHEHFCQTAPSGVDVNKSICLHKWISMVEFVDKVDMVLTKQNATSVYFTKSLYMPETAYSNLIAVFRSRSSLAIATRAEHRLAGLDLVPEQISYVEREIARQSKYFIAPTTSTWARTIIRLRPKEDGIGLVELIGQ
jgi:hypothetical protein